MSKRFTVTLMVAPEERERPTIQFVYKRTSVLLYNGQTFVPHHKGVPSHNPLHNRNFLQIIWGPEFSVLLFRILTNLCVFTAGKKYKKVRNLAGKLKNKKFKVKLAKGKKKSEHSISARQGYAPLGSGEQNSVFCHIQLSAYSCICILSYFHIGQL